ncbi:MAG TPA: multiheme c-type cytochrome [Steroidobacteraceae bacterium]|nr:multiheme c-type cytochrome [Steroidobacteraceae bacterium]
MVRSTAVALLCILAARASLAAAPAPTLTVLPAQGLNKHMGVTSCASSVCHGSVTPSKTYDVLLNEYVTWSHNDAHAKAFNVLRSSQSRAIAAKLGIGDPASAKECLDCHTDNVPPQQRGEKFSLADGIGCEACHGGSEYWLATHTSKRATYRDNVTHGMYPTADLRQRTELCLSCHYGTADKFATHRMMAAGHPRLSFEMETFLALQPPHYRIDEGYKKRKPTYTSTQNWSYGQLAAALRVMETLQGPRVNNSGAFPELALFNCYGCHMSSMRRTDWSHRLLESGAEPGSVPISDGYLIMAWIITRELDPSSAPGLLRMSRSLLAASASERSQIVERSRDVGASLRRLCEQAATRVWKPADERQLLRTLVAVGTSGEFHDYVGAEQAVMGIDGLLIHLGIAERFRQRIDELYKLTQNDEAYAPEQFVASLRQLQAELDRGTKD